MNTETVGLTKEARIERITRRFEQDQKSDRKAIRIGDVPISYESMTPEWLTAVLCSNTPGAAVTGYRLGPRDNGTSGRRRIYLEYNATGQTARLPATVFAKSSQELIHRISYQLNDTTHTEANFYNYVRPHLSIETPRPRYATSDAETGNSIVLLDDLEGRASFCDEDTTISREDAMSMVRTLADLHATFGTKSTLSSIQPYFRTWPVHWAGLVRMNEMQEYTDRGFLAAKQMIPKPLLARFEEVWPRTSDSVTQHESLPHTFCHGDTHLGNWYRKNDGQMGLTDWQGAHIGHWSRDFIYALGTTLAVEDRRRWQRELLTAYLERSRERGMSEVSFDQAWQWCRQQSLSALAYWTVTYTPSPNMPEDMQPKDRTLVFIGRLAHTVHDLEALDSFET